MLRKFEFHWAKSRVTEEASVKTPNHAPTIHLLEYESGEKAIRSCGFEGARMERYPFVIGEEFLAELGTQVRKNPKLIPAGALYGLSSYLTWTKIPHPPRSRVGKAAHQAEET